MNNLRDRCFVELQEYPYEIYKDSMDEALFARGLCNRKDSSFFFKCTGFIVSGKEIFIVFPKGYSIPTEESELKKHIQALAGTLLRYRNEAKLKEEEQELLGSPDRSTPEGIAAALWLIQDYQEYGYIRRETKQYRLNTGSKIDWARTLKTQQPILSGKSAVYVDVVTRKVNMDADHLIVRLHRYAVQKSYSKYGWIFGMYDYDMDPSLRESPYEPFYAEHIIQRELEGTYVDREIKLLHTLREFIIGSGENEKKAEIETLVTPYFHTVWEAMCGFVFRNEYETLKSLVPKPVWHFDGKDERTTQRPDILIQEKGTLYILDAKYFDVRRNRPGWHDMVKQFYYYFSLKQRLGKPIKNVLLFPGSTNDSIEYFGYVDIDGMRDLGVVESFCINIFTVMSSYSKNYQTDLREELLKMKQLK